MIEFEETFVLFFADMYLSIDNVLYYFRELKKIKRYLALLEVIIVALAISVLVS